MPNPSQPENNLQMAIKAKKYKPRFFPFSAGIPWQMEMGKYIIPNINDFIWEKTINNKNIIIVSFGGLLESFLSLMAAEAFKKTKYNNKLFWKGFSNFNDLVKFQGLCSISDVNITNDDIKNYPTPVFFDKNDNVYFNILNDYKIKKSYWGQCHKEVNLPIIEQIYRNICIPWDGFFPILRNIKSDIYDNLYKTGKIKKRTKIISIILNDVEDDILDWNIYNTREFAQLASNNGFKVVLFSKDANRFYGSNLFSYKYNYQEVIQFINKSWMVISNDIDWLIISMMISNAKIISKKMFNQYDLLKNADLIGVDNDIFTFNEWYSPIDVFNICKGLVYD